MFLDWHYVSDITWIALMKITIFRYDLVPQKYIISSMRKNTMCRLFQLDYPKNMLVNSTPSAKNACKRNKEKLHEKLLSFKIQFLKIYRYIFTHHHMKIKKPSSVQFFLLFAIIIFDFKTSFWGTLIWVSSTNKSCLKRNLGNKQNNVAR